MEKDREGGQKEGWRDGGSCTSGGGGAGIKSEGIDSTLDEAMGDVYACVFDQQTDKHGEKST